MGTGITLTTVTLSNWPCSLPLAEFSYEDLFRIWETSWAARLSVSEHFEEFLALAVMKQFQSAIMDAHLDPSDILNLFTGEI